MAKDCCNIKIIEKRTYETSIKKKNKKVKIKVKKNKNK